MNIDMNKIIKKDCSPNIDRIRQLTDKLGPPEGFVQGPGLKQYQAEGGKILAWTIHWQPEFAICHSFLSEGAVLKHHIHEEKEWIIVISGRISVETPDGITVLGPTQEIVIEPKTPHSVSTDVDTYVLAIAIPANSDWPRRWN